MPKQKSGYLDFQSSDIWDQLSVRMALKQTIQDAKQFMSGHGLPSLESFSVFLVKQTTLQIHAFFSQDNSSLAWTSS